MLTSLSPQRSQACHDNSALETPTLLGIAKAAILFYCLDIPRGPCLMPHASQLHASGLVPHVSQLHASRLMPEP